MAIITSEDYARVVHKINSICEQNNSGELADVQAFSQINDFLIRSRVGFINKILLNQYKGIVLSGVFAGMKFHHSAAEGCVAPKLLGCYEMELHPTINYLVQTKKYNFIIDIGCAEGYYAVGLARLFPNAKIYAFDINPNAQKMCGQLAKANQIQNQFVISGECNFSKLEELATKNSLIFCDCEGCEFNLLNINSVDNLKNSDLIIELHGLNSNLKRIQNFIYSFKDSHKITFIESAGRNPYAIPQIAKWKQLDQWLAVREFRGESTPWLFLESLT